MVLYSEAIAGPAPRARLPAIGSSATLTTATGVGCAPRNGSWSARLADAADVVIGIAVDRPSVTPTDLGLGFAENLFRKDVQHDA